MKWLMTLRFVAGFVALRTQLVSSPDPPHHAHFGKLEREFSEGAWCGGSGDETRTQYDAFLVDWRRDDGELNSLEARVATNRFADLRHTFALACLRLRGITNYSDVIVTR